MCRSCSWPSRWTRCCTSRSDLTRLYAGDQLHAFARRHRLLEIERTTPMNNRAAAIMITSMTRSWLTAVRRSPTLGSSLAYMKALFEARVPRFPFSATLIGLGAGRGPVKVPHELARAARGR